MKSEFFKSTLLFLTIFLCAFMLTYVVLSPNSLALTKIINDQSQNDYMYRFHLYYDNGQLFADRDFQFKYDVIAGQFVPQNITTPYPFKAEVVSVGNKIIASFQFDPKGGNIKFMKGKISVDAPYAANAQKVNFYDSQNNQLLSIYVSGSSFCNDDGICNSDVGEDFNSCPNDCKPLPTAKPTVSVPVTPTSSGPSIVMVLIYSIIGGGAVFGGYYAYNWWKEKKSSGNIIPPSQLPGNPVG